MYYLLDATSGGYYTGRTGNNWVMSDPSEAFGYESEAAAQRKADIMNKMRAAHGKRFEVVCNG